jgi:hypothetical protein
MGKLMDVRMVAVVRAAVSRMCARHRYHLRLRNKAHLVGLTYFCCRRHHSVEEIYICLGEHYFQQAYRILYESFLAST